MGTPFQDFVNDNLGVRMPLFIDTTTPELSSKAAGSLGSKFVDSSTNFIYEKTGYTNSDWVKIAELGDSRGGGGGSIELSGGYNITIDEIGSTYVINTATGFTGTFNAENIAVGTGEDLTLVVSESGQVGLNLFTGLDQVSGVASSFQFHVSGVTALSGDRNFYFETSPALTVIGNSELHGEASGNAGYFDNIFTTGSDGQFHRLTTEPSGINLGDMSTAQRNALGTLSYNKIIYNSTVDELQLYRSAHDNWVKIETGVAGS